MPKFERNFEVDPEESTDKIRDEIDEKAGHPKTKLIKRPKELGVEVPNKEEDENGFEEKYGKTPEFMTRINGLLNRPQKPTVSEVLPLVREFYEKKDNSVGGSLHIVLEDGNIENHSIEFCIEYAREHGDEEGVKLAQLLLRMSRTQRMKLHNQH